MYPDLCIICISTSFVPNGLQYFSLSVPLSNMKTTSFYVPLLTKAYVCSWIVTINGQAYTGNIPAGIDSPNVIRQINTTFPNYGTSNPSLNCGPNALATGDTLVANANPRAGPETSSLFHGRMLV